MQLGGMMVLISLFTHCHIVQL